ncbi:MAG: hypothetical protein K2X82_05720 [Gemmataceae bacterium]|nr:hypothetical protein [Gemmataceae bacterium]
MDPTTAPNQSRELVLLRLDQPFPEFAYSLLPTGLWQTVPYAFLGGLAFALLLVWLTRTVIRTTSPDPAWRHRPGRAGKALWSACVTVWVLFGLCVLAVFFLNDTLPRSPGASAGEVAAADRPTNTALWLGFTAAIFLLGSAYTAAMYVKDSRTVRWYWASLLAGLRISVYAILCCVFLLPAYQTYERTEKRSRVVVLLDISPSVTKVSDEIGTAPGRTPKSRLSTVIDFLTDEKVAFLKNLLDKNPVAVYRFGTRLDEEPTLLVKDDPAWAAAEWAAFAAYDFKPFVLKGLSPAAAEAVKASRPWDGAAPGTPEWANVWASRAEDEIIPEGLTPEDKETLKANRAKLEKRLDVARSIALGTNVPDSVTAAVNREAANMVQGVVVFTDGRSNLGSDSAYAELKQRATREKIPVFTVAVGEDRQAVGIVITEVQAPDNAPPDEAFKIIVEADGINLAGTETEVFLDLFLPNKDPKADPADYTFPPAKLVFQPGDPPHGQVEFVVDPAKLPPELTEESKDGAIKKRVLKESPAGSNGWTARARIPKHRQEVFPDPEHVRERSNIQVVRRPLRVLLMASGPGKDYQNLRTVLVREVQDARAELCIYLQNTAGESGAAVQDVPPERLLARFPTRLVTTPDPKADPKERFTNLNEFDLIVAFDPDWSELTREQAENLERWVTEQGGGLIYVADQVNTFQLARVEADSRLSPLLNILPVIPDDSIVIRARGTPRVPRRLYLRPIEGSDLLKLEESGDDPVGGWEKFFTDREKYAPSPDLRVELFPRRGFYQTYPLKDVKRDAKVLAELADVDDAGNRVLRPWLVVNNPSAAWRTMFVGSAQLWRLLAFDPNLGKDYFQRFWTKMMKYAAAKRNVKAARGRVLLAKEYIAGSPVRVQARILDPGAKAYPVGGIDPKFRVVRYGADGQREKELGPFPLAPKPGPSGFDGYYQGQLTPDPREMPAGDKNYEVVVEVPDSPGETLTGRFTLRRADPEMDKTSPDPEALLRTAGDLDRDLLARITRPEAKDRLVRELPKENTTPKLAFKLADRKLLELIPECMGQREVNDSVRGKAEDLWDQGFAVPPGLTPSFLKAPQTLSYVLLAVVGLLAVEWGTRKLLRLA